MMNLQQAIRDINGMRKDQRLVMNVEPKYRRVIYKTACIDTTIEDPDRLGKAIDRLMTHSMSGSGVFEPVVSAGFDFGRQDYTTYGIALDGSGGVVPFYSGLGFE